MIGCTRSEKAFAEWSKEEINVCNWNNRRFNVVFMAISPKEFRCISNCESAKEAWDIQEVTHQGSRGVKASKL